MLLWSEHNKKQNKKLLFALFLLGTAIFLDLLDGFAQKNSTMVFCFAESCNASVTHLLRLFEEVLEVLALGLLGYININLHCIENINIINKQNKKCQEKK